MAMIDPQAMMALLGSLPPAVRAQLVAQMQGGQGGQAGQIAPPDTGSGMPPVQPPISPQPGGLMARLGETVPTPPVQGGMGRMRNRMASGMLGAAMGGVPIMDPAGY